MAKYNVVRKYPKGDGTWYKVGQVVDLSSSKAARGVDAGCFELVEEKKAQVKPNELKTSEPPKTGLDNEANQGAASLGSAADPSATKPRL